MDGPLERVVEFLEAHAGFVDAAGLFDDAAALVEEKAEALFECSLERAVSLLGYAVPDRLLVRGVLFRAVSKIFLFFPLDASHLADEINIFFFAVYSCHVFSFLSVSF